MENKEQWKKNDVGKREKNKKNEQQEPGLDQNLTPDDISEEAGPPNHAILAVLGNEVIQVKDDICATFDACIQTLLCAERRTGYNPKRNADSIMALEKPTASHENISKEIEKSVSHHSDSVSSLQRQVTHVYPEAEKLT